MKTVIKKYSKTVDKSKETRGLLLDNCFDFDVYVKIMACKINYSIKSSLSCNFQKFPSLIS